MRAIHKGLLILNLQSLFLFLVDCTAACVQNKQNNIQEYNYLWFSAGLSDQCSSSSVSLPSHSRSNSLSSFWMWITTRSLTGGGCTHGTLSHGRGGNSAHAYWFPLLLDKKEGDAVWFWDEFENIYHTATRLCWYCGVIAVGFWRDNTHRVPHGYVSVICCLFC